MSKFYVFVIDVDVSEDSPPPLPERTPESFVLASEHSEYIFWFYIFHALIISSVKHGWCQSVAVELHN